MFCYSIPTGIHLPCIFLQKKSSSSGISTCLVWIITIYEIFCGLKQKPIPVFHFLFLLQLPFSLVLKTVDTEVVVVVRIWNKKQNFSPFYIKIIIIFKLIYFLISICFSMHTSCFVACVSLPFVMVREQCCRSLSSLSFKLTG